MNDFSAIPMVANSMYSIITFVNIFFNDLQVVLDEYGGF
jgi:hypothetical protein